MQISLFYRFMVFLPYVNHILEWFYMQECKPVSTPFDPHSHLVAATATDIVTIPFKEAIGCLLYVALISQPDISYAVSAIAKHCKRPTAPH